VLSSLVLLDHLGLRPGLPEARCGVDPSSDQADTDLGWLDIGHLTCLGNGTILALAELIEASL